MNNQEINKRIAEKKGHRTRKHKGQYFILEDDCHPGSCVGVTVCDPKLVTVPDYINDPVLNRELELELMSNRWWPRLDKEEYFYRRDVWWSPDIGKNKDFGLATCLAWLEEFKDAKS